MNTTIEISARHIHLTKEDFFTLFGLFKMSKRNNLSQKNEFASAHTVELVGPKSRILNVRVNGDFRNYSQVEISKTDAYNLGIDAPLKISGESSGAKIRIIGPKGEIIKNIAIIAKRHLHLNTKIANKYNLKNGKTISVEIAGERPTVFRDVVVRIAENYSNHLHLDTDEGNAANINKQANAKVYWQKGN